MTISDTLIDAVCAIDDYLDYPDDDDDFGPNQVEFVYPHLERVRNAAFCLYLMLEFDHDPTNKN